MKKIISLAILTIAFLSCREEEITNPRFSYLDMEDAYGFVLGKPASGEFTSQKLYKINNTDNLVEVKYLDDNKKELKNIFVPMAIYDFNKTFFLVTYSNIYQTEFETYLIRRVDGMAQKLPQPVIVEKDGEVDLNIHAIRVDNNLDGFFLNSKGNWKINLSYVKSAMNVEHLKGEVLGNDFTVDYLGNILTNQKFYSVNGNSKTLEWSNPEYTFPLESFINNMHYIFRKGDSVQSAQINTAAGSLSEKKLYPSFLMNPDEAKFIGSHAFSDINKIVAVLASNILVLDGSTIKKANMAKLNLKKIYLATFSGKFCFVYGEDPVNDKVFVRIDLKGPDPVYTQIMAPNDVEITSFSASGSDNLIFSGKRLSNGKPIFGYIPYSGSNWIFENDNGISDLQVLAR